MHLPSAPRCLIVLALAQANLALAAAPDWTASFPAAPTAAHLKPAVKTVLVAAGGAKSDDTSSATQAVVATLRQGPPARTVLTGEALGDVTALDDASIAKKAAHLPVDIVAVVRVFPAAGGAPLAVVAFLTPAGEPVAAVSVQKGQPLAPPAGVLGGSGPGQGASTAAADAVARTRQEAEANTDGRSPLEEYNRKFIGFQDWVGVNQYGGVVAQWTQPFQGSHHRNLDLDEFYESVGQPELASSVRTRRWVRLSLVLGGLGVMGGGLGYMLTDMTASSKCSDAYEFGSQGYDACNTAAETYRDDHLKGGAVLMGVGLGVALAAAFVPANPASAQEGYDMAERHNKALRQKLGLPEPQARAPGLQWFARASGGLGAAGMTLGARF